MTIEFTRLFKGESAVFKIGDYGFFKLAKQTGSGGGGGDISFSRIFSENSPETISAVSAEISANNMTSAQVAETYGWNLGDKTSITLSTGEVIEMQIIGFNHDDKSDGSGKAGITLQMVNCLATSYKMKNVRSNAGGYGDSYLRISVLPTIELSLPEDWQNIIIPVIKKYANGGGTNYSATNSVDDSLFIPSQIEIMGNSDSQDGLNEGYQYEFWSGKTDDDRIKQYDADGDGVVDTATSWWLRSCYTGTNHMRRIKEDGTIGQSYSNSSLRVSFAFCV